MTKNANKDTSYYKIMPILGSSFIHKIHISQGKLQSQGVESFIADENMTTIGFVKNYRLLIRSFGVIKANFILNAIE